MRNDIDVGFTWLSNYGERKIIGRSERHGSEVFLVSTEGGLPQLVRASEVASEIHRDTKNLESRTRALQARQEIDAKTIARESWYGFTDRMTPTARARAIAALEVSVRRNGRPIRRGDLVVELLKDGWVVGEHKGRRILTDPRTEAYLLEKDVTKTAIDLAEFIFTTTGGNPSRDPRRHSRR